MIKRNIKKKIKEYFDKKYNMQYCMQHYCNFYVDSAGNYVNFIPNDYLLELWLQFFSQSIPEKWWQNKYIRTILCLFLKLRNFLCKLNNNYYVKKFNLIPSEEYGL